MGTFFKHHITFCNKNYCVLTTELERAFRLMPFGGKIYTRQKDAQSFVEIFFSRGNIQIVVYGRLLRVNTSAKAQAG